DKYFNKTGNYYDIVISDINMPKLNGIEMAKAIKNINPHQEIMVVSAYNDSDKLMRLIDLGINYFLLKPISFEKTLDTLYKVSQSVANKKASAQYLISQSKNAAMGEMIDMIAHQWLAQVNIMNIRADIAKMDIKDGYINNDEIDKFLVDQRGGFSHLTQTLNEFRGFFTQNNKLEKIPLLKILQSVQILLKDNLVNNTVELEVFIDESIEVNIIPNEFKHILINLIQNSIDAFNENNIENREITVKSYKKEATTILEYYDNAGGIDEKKIDKVFEPRYTTKTTGTGMGMYLSKLILDKIGASIKVLNYKSGAKFIVDFKYS
ncbi:MAG: hybrid sensor histidine kinase/response regulator, partial [Campylobacterota bacterium]|nr:hybrid sensor histidine kinase/response regulator [Campylobacterota bacterium]